VNSHLAQTAGQTPVLVATADNLPAGQTAELQALGCEWLPLAMTSGRPDVLALLDELGRRRMTNVLVEGGSEVLGSFLDARALDEVHVFVAPRLAGGAQARTPVGGRGVEQIAAAVPLTEWHLEQVEDNILVHGRLG
jgi:diaminohydroxyphosphoribosylaminopyrimidine deaminase/5-amino-6-(5-phosphoribosylamino)uracil reductase